MRVDHFLRDQNRRFLAGNGGGGDDHVLFLQDRGHLLALAADGVFVERAGVTALAFAA